MSEIVKRVARAYARDLSVLAQLVAGANRLRATSAEYGGTAPHSAGVLKAWFSLRAGPTWLGQLAFFTRIYVLFWSALALRSLLVQLPTTRRNIVHWGEPVLSELFWLFSTTILGVGFAFIIVSFFLIYPLLGWSLIRFGSYAWDLYMDYQEAQQRIDDESRRRQHSERGAGRAGSRGQDRSRAEDGPFNGRRQSHSHGPRDEASSDSWSNDQRDTRLDTSFEVLGVSRNATPKEIRKAYVDLVFKHHPDRWQTAPPVQRAAAEERTKLLTAAYCYLQEVGVAAK